MAEQFDASFRPLDYEACMAADLSNENRETDYYLQQYYSEESKMIEVVKAKPEKLTDLACASLAGAQIFSFNGDAPYGGVPLRLTYQFHLVP